VCAISTSSPWIRLRRNGQIWEAPERPRCGEERMGNSPGRELSAKLVEEAPTVNGPTTVEPLPTRMDAETTSSSIMPDGLLPGDIKDGGGTSSAGGKSSAHAVSPCPLPPVSPSHAHAPASSLPSTPFTVRIEPRRSCLLSVEHHDGLHDARHAVCVLRGGVRDPGLFGPCPLRLVGRARKL
jgi:hypothetical protein